MTDGELEQAARAAEQADETFLRSLGAAEHVIAESRIGARRYRAIARAVLDAPHACPRAEQAEAEVARLRAERDEWRGMALGAGDAREKVTSRFIAMRGRAEQAEVEIERLRVAITESKSHLFWKHVVTNHERHTDDVGCLGYDCSAITRLNDALAVPPPEPAAGA